jgi:hypothetical protein
MGYFLVAESWSGYDPTARSRHWAIPEFVYDLLEDLPTQVEAEDVTVGFERAVSGDHSKFKTTIQHKTWTAEEVAEEMGGRILRR